MQEPLASKLDGFKHKNLQSSRDKQLTENSQILKYFKNGQWSVNCCLCSTRILHSYVLGEADTRYSHISKKCLEEGSS